MNNFVPKVVGDNICYSGEKLEILMLLKSFIIIQNSIEKILIKYFGETFNPRIEGNNLLINNIELLISKIKYYDLEDYSKDSWEKLWNLIYLKEQEASKKSNDYNTVLATAWSDKEVQEELEKIFTKIENEKSGNNIH